MSKRKNKRNRNKVNCNINNKCDTKCIYFPLYVDKDIEYEVYGGVKYRKNPVCYICGYDGHKIEHFCNFCDNKKTISSYRRKIYADIG